MRGPALAWSLSTASIIMAIAGVWLALMGDAGDRVVLVGIAPTMIVFAVVGAFVASRRTPRKRLKPSVPASGTKPTSTS
jgi:hypothetical protein